jgi:YD repeat-containing protein
MDRLERVQYPDGKLTKYSYNSENQITAVDESSEGFILENTYDSDGQLTEQSMNGKHLYSFRYSPDEIAKTLEVSVIRPQGKVTKVKIVYTDKGQISYSVAR